MATERRPGLICDCPYRGDGSTHSKPPEEHYLQHTKSAKWRCPVRNLDFRVEPTALALSLPTFFRASTRVYPSGAAFCNQNRESPERATTELVSVELCSSVLALQHRPTPTSEVVA